MKVSRKQCIEQLEELVETLLGLGAAMEWDGVNDPHVECVNGVILEIEALMAGLRGDV